MKFPWLIAGTLLGVFVGWLIMPAEARVGIRFGQALHPIFGAIIGIFLGAIAELFATRVRPPR